MPLQTIYVAISDFGHLVLCCFKFCDLLLFL
jgi:hypothetical protein